MLVSSDTNAAQSRAPGEATRFFDDIGCLATDVKSRADGTDRYVHLAAGDWAPVESAWFALGRGTRTPMDYGIFAFTTREDAQAADRDGQAHAWPSIVTHAEAR